MFIFIAGVDSFSWKNVQKELNSDFSIFASANDIEDSPGAQTAASLDKPKAAADVCSPQLEEVRKRCDQHTHEVKA